MTLLLKWGKARGDFPEPSKLLLICDSPAREETEKQAFKAEGRRFNVVQGSRYLGTYDGPME